MTNGLEPNSQKCKNTYMKLIKFLRQPIKQLGQVGGIPIFPWFVYYSLQSFPLQ